LNLFGKVDQARNRFFVLIISFLVLVVTLAGLMGILDLLPQPVSSGASPDGDLPASSQPGTSTTDKKPEGQSPILDGVESFVGISSTISLRVDPPPHIPVFEVSGAATTSYLKSIAATYYEDEIWRSDDNAQQYSYEGETLRVPVASYNRKTEDDIAVASLLSLPPGTTPLPTSLYPIRVSADVPLLYFPEEQVFHSEEVEANQ